MRRDGGLAVPITTDMETLKQVVADRGRAVTTPGLCGGTAIVHRSRQVTCSDPECADEILGRSPLGTHDVFVSCNDVLGPLCPVCAPSSFVSDVGRDL